MTNDRILAEIDAEIAHLKQVRALLSPTDMYAKSGASPKRKRRKMSKAGRESIAAAQRERWARKKISASKKA